MTDLIEIDGSYGEGGGQVVRTSLTLAAMLGKSVHIRHIRAGRSKPGLAPQHLTNVLALAQICAAKVTGAALKSTDVLFEPQRLPEAGNYAFDVAEASTAGSAGAVTLICQTLFLPLAFAKGESNLTLAGGTHVSWSPPFDYIQQVFLPLLDKMGVGINSELSRWGFYPTGGGEITAVIPPISSPLRPLSLLEKGELKRVWGTAVASNLPAHIAQRMADQATRSLSHLPVPVVMEPKRVRGMSKGAGLFLFAEYEWGVAGFSTLGHKRKRSEDVAEEVCNEFVAYHGQSAPVDAHLGDQLLLPMALANGRSHFQVTKITQHLLTNAHVIRQFLPVDILISGKEGGPGKVSVEGFGHPLAGE